MYIFKALGTSLSFLQKMLAFCVKGTTVSFRSICFVSRLGHSSYKNQDTLGSSGMSPFGEVTALQAQGKSQTLAECWGPCSGPGAVVTSLEDPADGKDTDKYLYRALKSGRTVFLSSID